MELKSVLSTPELAGVQWDGQTTTHHQRKVSTSLCEQVQSDTLFICGVGTFY